MPIVLTSCLMGAVFALPIESGEKMGFSLTVLLSYVVFLTWVTDNLPPISSGVSILRELIRLSDFSLSVPPPVSLSCVSVSVYPIFLCQCLHRCLCPA